ncbi:hypothetical protein P3342_011232 [Pyrenophora teres f. teres]|nr:hypothetical protein P3342_011232 [Pyrenophora teres f. teres]
MSRVKMDLAYAILMSQCTEGTFLYTPASADRFRPGACGYFDDTGLWEDIVDLRDYRQLAQKHYKCPQDQLVTMLQPPTSSTWEPLSVEREEDKGFKVNAGLSGVAAQTPIDLGFDAERKRTSDAGASLTTLSPVENHRFNSEAEAILMKWMEDNRKNLVLKHGSQIEQYGVWIITQTWVTEKCEISMWNKTGKSVEAGTEVGATNIGKFKANASSSINSGVDQKKLWDKEPGGYAISFKGLWFRPTRNVFSKELVNRAPRDGFLRTGHVTYLEVDGNGETHQVTMRPETIEAPVVFDVETVG